MKRMLAAALLLSLLFTLSGCGEWEEEPHNDLYETLADYYGKNEDEDTPPVLTSFALPYLSGETADPITCIDGAQQTLGTLLYEGLFTLDPCFVPQLMLAESCSYDDAACRYTVTLRQGVLFSDETELTARDVVYSLNRAKTSARYASRLTDAVSISSSGSYTVIIQLSRDNAAFAARLDIPIVKSGTGGRTYPIGTGPYYYLSDETGAHLAVNSHWWQKKELPLSRIELVRCKDSDTMAYAFYAREIQLMMCDLTATATANVYGSGNYTDAATTTMQYIGVNTTRPVLASSAVRQALSLGIDRQGCIDAFFLGHALAAQSPVSPVSALYPQSLDTPYSPDNFDSAMVRAGYSGETTVRLTLLVNTENSFKLDAARRIAQDLSHHGLQISVKALPWEQYLLALQNGEFDLYYGECRLSADWDLRSLVGTGGALNFGGYTSARTDALLSAAMSAGEAERAEAMLTLCTQLQQDSPILPICFKNVSILLPSGAVESITPTAANPFYGLTDWQIDLG